VTAIRFDIADPDGVIQVDNGMLSSPQWRTAEQDAQQIAEDFPAGWTVRLWKDVPLFGSLAELGKPDAVVVSGRQT